MESEKRVFASGATPSARRLSTSQRYSLGKTRGLRSVTGKRCSVGTSFLQTRCTCAPSAPSTSLCGTSRASPWICRSTSCWVVLSGTRSFAIRIRKAKLWSGLSITANRRWTTAGSSCAGGSPRPTASLSTAGTLADLNRCSPCVWRSSRWERYVTLSVRTSVSVLMCTRDWTRGTQSRCAVTSSHSNRSL